MKFLSFMAPVFLSACLAGSALASYSKERTRIIKLTTVKATNLPKMDIFFGTVDGFVSVSFGEKTHRTNTVEKNYDPKWNDIRYYYVKPGSDLSSSDNTLSFTVMDGNKGTASKLIGNVEVKLADLTAGEREKFSILKGSSEARNDKTKKTSKLFIRYDWVTDDEYIQETLQD